jgi:hypothetical protein
MSSLPFQPPMIDVEESADLSGEDLQVAVWRYAECRRLELSPEEARAFADSRCDLNVLRNLIGKGCPPSLALEIVL